MAAMEVETAEIDEPVEAPVSPSDSTIKIDDTKITPEPKATDDDIQQNPEEQSEEDEEEATADEQIDEVEAIDDELEPGEVVMNGDANSNNGDAVEASESSSQKDGEVMEVDDDDEEDDCIETTAEKQSKNDDDGDVLVISEKDEVHEVDDQSDDDVEITSETTAVVQKSTPEKSVNGAQQKKKVESPVTPRRSSRNVQRKSVKEDSESDIEEVLPQDPLDTPKSAPAPAIVVKDTKRLVEIASKTQSSPSSGKKEPTLVIIDTNSILSGRGPVPVNKNANSATIVPVSQSIYNSNVRGATITPIPMNTSITVKATSSSAPAATATTTAPILPSLTDDMFVVEAPSFIVPYVYEKPPVDELKKYVSKLAEEVNKEMDDEDAKDDKENEEDEKEPGEITPEEVKKEENKNPTFFESPIGKFFLDIGHNLVQEYVQTDLLRQQKRKREREGGANADTNKTIQSLLKNLEYTKENNAQFKLALKKCEFCHYKTESQLAMAFHLETPHMKNFSYRCNYCQYESRSPHEILFHMEAEHCVRGRLERAPAFHACPNCPFEDNQKGKLSRHLVTCAKKFKPERNLEPALDWEPPAKIPRAPRNIKQNTGSLGTAAAMYQAMMKNTNLQMQYLKMPQGGIAAAANAGVTAASVAQLMQQATALNRARGRPTHTIGAGSVQGAGKMNGIGSKNGVTIQPVSGANLSSVLVPANFGGNQLYTVGKNSPGSKKVHQPSISITPLPRGTTATPSSSAAVNNALAAAVAAGGANIPTAPPGMKPGDVNSKSLFVICEICDGYIKDLEQLRNHMQWIHKVKIHPKMIYNRPPLNCQKCQFRFFTDQGLERHLLGSHGLVTSSMQDAANKCKDAGRCPVCGRVYQWKLLNHVARDHNMTLKPAHLSYKCTVCTATFGMYKQFESHVYSAHSVVAKRSGDKKGGGGSSASPASTSKSSSAAAAAAVAASESLLKPLKINDEITIIPQMPKSNGSGGQGKDSSANKRTGGGGNAALGGGGLGESIVGSMTSVVETRAERLARRKNLTE